MSAIEVKNLSFSYHSKHKKAVDSVSFKIEQGEHVVILGNNGSGKSTLAKLLIGILKPSEGEIYIKDKLMDKNNYINNVSIVFQNPDNQFIATTVEEDIAFGLENKCIEREKMQLLVREYADKVHMSDCLKSEPSKLSGGQKQRVAIAGALVLGNDVLILDEATSMLDPKGKRDILNLIQEIKQEKPELTVISITHHVNEILSADKVMILDEGKLLYFDHPNVVFNDVNKQEITSFLPFILQFKKKMIEAGISLKNDDLEGICKELCQ